MIAGSASGTRHLYCLRILVSRLTGCGGDWSRKLGEVRIEKTPGGTGSPGCHRTMYPGMDAIAPVEPAGPCAAAASTKPNAKTRPNAKRSHMLSSEGSRRCGKTVSLTYGGAYAKSAESRLRHAVLPHMRCGVRTGYRIALDPSQTTKMTRVVSRNCIDTA